MDPLPLDEPAAYGGLALVGPVHGGSDPSASSTRRPSTGRSSTGRWGAGGPGTGGPGAGRPGTGSHHDVPAGDICVYYEPTGTVVRLFGRVEGSMRTEIVEAALDVASRGGPVTIEVAPDAWVDPALLLFLRRVCESPDRAPGGPTAAERLRSPHRRAQPVRPQSQDTERPVPAAR